MHTVGCTMKKGHQDKGVMADILLKHGITRLPANPGRLRQGLR